MEHREYDKLLDESRLIQAYPHIKIIQPSFEIISMEDYDHALKKLERIGRVCYHSEDKIEENSAEQFISNILKRGHESVIEHVSITVLATVDRGITHEIVRHRIASYSQESTRYCDYSKDKYGSRISVVDPRGAFWKFEYPTTTEMDRFERWCQSMNDSAKAYKDMRKLGATPQEARGVLPTSLASDIVITYNLREWRHFFRMRTASGAHPQIVQIASMILSEFQKQYPLFFNEF